VTNKTEKQEKTTKKRKKKEKQSYQNTLFQGGDGSKGLVVFTNKTGGRFTLNKKKKKKRIHKKINRPSSFDRRRLCFQPCGFVNRLRGLSRRRNRAVLGMGVQERERSRHVPSSEA